MKKTILGLDLGTNSIGWAIVEESESGKQIAAVGSRILPMDAKEMGDFESGNSISETADRTNARGVRRLYERRILRRERLNRVLDVLGFLPPDYAAMLNNYGQIIRGSEPKIAWSKKGEFLYMDSFLEMVECFREAQPELLSEGKTLPYDWTIYYLRKKALTQALTGQELAWVLHQFNSKRGYNQSRSEQEETNPTERQEYMSLLVTKVVNTGEQKNGKTWYEIHLENGLVYRRQSAYPLDWEGRKRDFIIKTKLNEDGTDKVDRDGQIKYSISAPKDDDWGLRKIKTEHDILGSKKTVGEFIFDALLANPDEKIIGQLVRTIDRKYYKEELRQILEKQKEFLPQLSDNHLYDKAIHALYQQNEAYRNSIARKDFTYLLLEDVLFYQRPLKTKKSLINECPYEYRTYRNKDGETVKQYLKCISKSHPIYEEYRVWQFVNNLRVYYTVDGLRTEDVTAERMNKDEVATWLLTLKEVDQKAFIKHIAGKATAGLSWNYVSDKVYPMAPTRALINKALAGQVPTNDDDYYEHLWHILYSVSDKQQLEQAIGHYAEKNGLNEDFVNIMKKQKPFASDYGAFSEKAIRRLLALMRCGSKWSADLIDPQTQLRIQHILTGEENDMLDARVREKCKDMQSVNDMQGLQSWLAEYVVYDVRKFDSKWHTPEQIDEYLQDFRLHSLNNPVVEKVVKETLRVVRDLWKQIGHIDEIHLEMGRNLKQTAAQRKQDTDRNLQNERANEEARKALLEILPNPSLSDIKKYRLWKEQGERSPYTGQNIPLAALFSAQYEIEHVIPQSRYFDDSMSNKIVCEAEVNKLKDRQLGHAFIKQHAGEKVTLSGGKVVTVFTVDAYEDFIKQTFANNKAKTRKLMLDEIPEEFIQRQLNDSRYISNLMRGLLSNIVRECNPETGEYEPEATSKNLIVINGSVTDRLKKDWGVNDVWKRIILPRFERMNRVTNSSDYTYLDNGHWAPTIPAMGKQMVFKRIDHRHHAMDAIVIACATRNHVALLSNENAAASKNETRYDLNHLLRETIETVWNGKKHYIFGSFIKPWPTFAQDVEQALRNIVVSIKQDLRVINKSKNLTMHIKDGKKQLQKQTKGNHWAIRKALHKETVFGLVNLQKIKTVKLSVALTQLDRIVNAELRSKLRQLLAQGYSEKAIIAYFKEESDVWKDVNLKSIEVYYYTNETNERYYATRKAIDTSFTAKYIKESVTDTGIQQILLRHLEANEGNPELAFSPDGLERMNENIQTLNNGVPHKPIYKVRYYEKANKFAVGNIGNKKTKFVEAAKGTNLFIFVYWHPETKERKYIPISFVEAVNAQKKAQKNWKNYLLQKIADNGLVESSYKFAFSLSPGDVVYIPEENEDCEAIKAFSPENLYKMVSFSGTQINFVPLSSASVISDKIEYGPLNKMERSIDGRMIKEVCIPIHIDRLGNIL